MGRCSRRGRLQSGPSRTRGVLPGRNATAVPGLKARAGTASASSTAAARSGGQPKTAIDRFFFSPTNKSFGLPILASLWRKNPFLCDEDRRGLSALGSDGEQDQPCAGGPGQLQGDGGAGEPVRRVDHAVPQPLCDAMRPQAAPGRRQDASHRGAPPTPSTRRRGAAAQGNRIGPPLGAINGHSHCPPCAGAGSGGAAICACLPRH